MGSLLQDLENVVEITPKARFLYWMMEGPELGEKRGAPLLKHAPFYGLDDERLDEAQVQSLLAQPWLCIGTCGNDRYCYAEDHEALIGWCVSVGYISAEEKLHIQAILTMRLMEDE